MSTSDPKPEPPLDPDLEHLSDEALVAILVGPQAAKRLLDQAISLQALARWTLAEIVHKGGVPEKKARALSAGLTAGRRGSTKRIERGMTIAGTIDAYHALKPILAHLQREKFVILLVDAKMKLISARVVSTGSLTATMVPPRDVFGPALLEHAFGIILAHNHPSGHADPSEEDRALTRRLVATGDLMGVRVLDHLIVGDEDFYSFADNGQLRL